MSTNAKAPPSYNSPPGIKPTGQPQIQPTGQPQIQSTFQPQVQPAVQPPSGMAPYGGYVPPAPPGRSPMNGGSFTGQLRGMIGRQTGVTPQSPQARLAQRAVAGLQGGKNGGQGPAPFSKQAKNNAKGPMKFGSGDPRAQAIAAALRNRGGK